MESVDRRQNRRVGTDDSVQATYERYLRAGFGQTGYLVRDILLYGAVMPETDLRVDNELDGLAIEKLGKPFVTEFMYRRSPQGLVAEDGELLRDIFTRGLEVAQEEALKDPSLDFRVKRYEADVQHADYLESLVLDPERPVGTTVIIVSPCPSSHELGVPKSLLKDYYYQPELDMAVSLIATKTELGITIETVNLFHAGSEILHHALATTLAQPIPVLGREEMAWARYELLPDPGTDVANQLRASFDVVLSSNQQEPTFHGLTKAEHPENIQSGALVHNEQFIRSRIAAREMMKNVASSLVHESCYIPHDYLQTILCLRRPDGTFELEGDRRTALLALLEGSANKEQFESAMQSVHQVTCAGLWATLRTLYDGGQLEQSSFSSADSAMDSLGQLQFHRSTGSQENGCPGGGNNSQESIFEMNPEKLLSIFFVEKFRTNCPLCDEKNVEATKTNGTITCGECSGSVEICTGEVIRKSNKKKKIKKISQKPISIYRMLGFGETKSKKAQKREKMVA